MSHAKPDQTSDLVAYHAYPQLAAAVRSRIPSILKRWEEATRTLLPHAERLTHADFRDDVPLTLKRMADALESSRPMGLYDLEDTARVHGTSRFDQHFNIRDVITEFRLLRRIILEEVHDELGERLTFGEVVELSMATDTALQEALLSFVDHQRDQLRASNEAEAKFLSFMSHDMRNHLNHVTLVIQEVALTLERDPKYLESAADLHSAQRSIFETIEGMEKLLQSERLRKGDITPKSSPVNLRELGHEVLQLFQQNSQKKGLDLQLGVPEEAMLNTDRQLLGLVLQNLVGNAIKYTVAGWVKVEACPWVEGKTKGWAISVSDSGPGIAEADFKRLFDAFTRGNTHGQAGMGLGLAIVSQATKVLRGTVTVESTLGRGSTFCVRVPGLE